MTTDKNEVPDDEVREILEASLGLIMEQMRVDAGEFVMTRRGLALKSLAIADAILTQAHDDLAPYLAEANDEIRRAFGLLLDGKRLDEPADEQAPPQAPGPGERASLPGSGGLSQ